MTPSQFSPENIELALFTLVEDTSGPHDILTAAYAALKHHKDSLAQVLLERLIGAVEVWDPCQVYTVALNALGALEKDQPVQAMNVLQNYYSDVRAENDLAAERDGPVVDQDAPQKRRKLEREEAVAGQQAPDSLETSSGLKQDRAGAKTIVKRSRRDIEEEQGRK